MMHAGVRLTVACLLITKARRLEGRHDEVSPRSCLLELPYTRSEQLHDSHRAFRQSAGYIEGFFTCGTLREQPFMTSNLKLSSL